MRALVPWLALLAGCPSPEPGPDTDTDAAIDTDPTAPQRPTADAGPDREVAVGEAFTLTATVEGSVTWDLGDGTLAQGAEVTHTYTQPGNHVVIQQVTGAGGLRATDTARVVAYLPAAATPPTVSSPLALSADGATLWVAVPEADHVARIDTASQRATYHPACATPRSVSVRGATVVVACEDDGRLAVLDATTGRLLRHLDTGPGSRPAGVVQRDGAVYVALSGRGELRRLSLDGSTNTGVRDGLRDPWAVGLLPDGRALTARFRGNEGRLCTAPADTTPVCLDADGPQGGHVHLGDTDLLLAVDQGPDSDTANRGTPNLLQQLVITPDGGTAWIAATVANQDRGLFTDGREPTFETSLRAQVRQVDLAAGTERYDGRVRFDNHGNATALALSPRGNWLWVALQNTDTVARVDAYTSQSAGAILDAGRGIDGLAVSPDGATLYVHAWLDREVRAFDIADLDAPVAPQRWAAPTVATEPLAAEVLRGKRLFYDATDTRVARDGYLSCSTCHPFGSHDGLTWDFRHRGEGLRNTITLRGRAGTAMGMIHWTGNFDEVHDFENDIRNGQAGTGLLAEADWTATSDPLGDPKAGRSADLDALNAYVTSLDETEASPFPPPFGGADLFATAGCGDCHAPETLYTDSVVAPDPVRHDVGTWREGRSGVRRGEPNSAFDTPTLLGVWATPPYLHDGRAPTLRDAIEAHDGPDYRLPDALTSEELDTLAAYVRSL